MLLNKYIKSSITILVFGVVALVVLSRMDKPADTDNWIKKTAFYSRVQIQNRPNIDGEFSNKNEVTITFTYLVNRQSVNVDQKFESSKPLWDLQQEYIEGSIDTVLVNPDNMAEATLRVPEVSSINSDYQAISITTNIVLGVGVIVLLIGIGKRIRN